MKIEDCNVGDQIKAPVSTNKSFMYSGNFANENEYVIVTLLQKGDGGTIIGWNDEGRGISPYSQHVLAALNPELKKKFPKIEHATEIASGVSCELVTAWVDENAIKKKSPPVGFLLACIGMGAGISHFTMSQHKNQHVKRSASHSTN